MSAGKEPASTRSTSPVGDRDEGVAEKHADIFQSQRSERLRARGRNFHFHLEPQSTRPDSGRRDHDRNDPYQGKVCHNGNNVAVTFLPDLACYHSSHRHDKLCLGIFRVRLTALSYFSTRPGKENKSECSTIVYHPMYFRVQSHSTYPIE